MAIVYRIYSNDGAGGPIDYSTPIATTADPSYTINQLAAPGRYRFGVHACDASSGVEELNTQVSVCITLDADGNDVGEAPMPPYALVATPTANGGCRVAWTYPSRGPGPSPTSFLVYLTAGTTPALSSPVVIVPFGAGRAVYGCQLGGLADGMLYALAVVSQATGGRSSGVTVATVVGDSTPPADVDALTANAIP